MSEQKQVMALNPARKGNMGRINSLQPLAVYDQLIAQPWLKGLVEQIRGEKPMAGVDAANGKAAAKAREELKRQLPFRATTPASETTTARRAMPTPRASFSRPRWTWMTRSMWSRHWRRLAS